MSTKYKAYNFGRKKRKSGQINNIKRMNVRKEICVAQAECDSSVVPSEADGLSFGTDDSQTMYLDDVDVGLYEEFESGNFVTENVCQSEDFGQESSSANGEFVIDDIDDWSDSTDESAWSVCSLDEDCVSDSECFFLYGGVSDKDDSDCESEMSFCSSDYDEQQNELIGNRIIDLSHIFSEIRKINQHSKSGSCNFNDMRFAKSEVKRGFVSYLRLRCTKCNYIHVLKTCERRDDQFDLNYECVLGSMLIGIGFSQLEEFTGTLDIPCITPNAYRKKAKKIYGDLSNAAEFSTQLVAEAEIEFAKKKDSVDTKVNPLVTGVVDAALSKRSYRTNYSALSGSAVLIGYSTGKVLWQGVANKFCSVCKFISTNSMEHYHHHCNINYVGPSTGMEPKLIVDGLKYCDHKFGIRIHRIIGDGDSSVLDRRAHV